MINIARIIKHVFKVFFTTLSALIRNLSNVLQTIFCSLNSS